MSSGVHLFFCGGHLMSGSKQLPKSGSGARVPGSRVEGGGYG